MTWAELTDRSAIMCNAHKGTLLLLLKEAERELSKHVNMYEVVQTISTSSETVVLETSSYQYKEMIAVTVNGNHIMPISESEINYKSDGTKHAGTPNAYYITTDNYIAWDTIPSTSDVIKCSMYVYITEGLQGSFASPMLSKQFHISYVDYAVYVATAKTDPDVSERHYAKWLKTIKDTKDLKADQELIHTVKGVV